MKTPEGLNWQEYNLAIKDWYNEHAVRAKGQATSCKTCERQITFKWVPLSIHIEGWPGCAGNGTVFMAFIPFCSNCEPEPGPGCLHLPSPLG